MTIISYLSLAFFSATVSLLIPERKLSKLAGPTRVAIVLDAATQRPLPKNLVVFGFPPKTHLQSWTVTPAHFCRGGLFSANFSLPSVAWNLLEVWDRFDPDK